MKQLNVRIPDSLAEALRAYAVEEHRDLSNAVRVLLSRQLGVVYHEKMDETLNPELPLS